MTRFIKIFISFIVLCSLSFSLTAQEDAQYQADAIISGDLASAEKELLAVLDANPDDPYALLNLAYVYQRAGEQKRASQLYSRILTLKANPYAELASGEKENVKNIARRGIARIESTNP